MDSSKVLSLLEQLDDEIDDLEESLEPLLKQALSDTSSKLPLLDKAKLFVLVTYAIESMLFSYLRLNGVKAREHPVFLELTRVKQYFDKIKTTENPAPLPVRNMALDKSAAGRFVKAGLTGNERYDLERAERQAKERARAHIKFEELSTSTVQKRKTDDEEEEKVAENTSDSDSDSESSSESSAEAAAEPVVTPVLKKKRKLEIPESLPTSGSSTPSVTSKKSPKNVAQKQRQGSRKARKEKKKKSKKAKKESS